jgi:hypothetical protein
MDLGIMVTSILVSMVPSHIPYPIAYGLHAINHTSYGIWDVQQPTKDVVSTTHEATVLTT